MEHCWEDKTGNAKHKQEFKNLGFVKDSQLDLDMVLKYVKKGVNELKNGIEKYVVCNCTSTYISYGGSIPISKNLISQS